MTRANAWLPALVLVLAAALPLRAEDGGAPVMQVRDRLASPEVLRGEFEQEKQLQGFRNPLRSRGGFVLARGRGVIWQTREPFPSTVVVTRERVVEQAPDGATSVLLDGAGSPGAALVNALLLALVAGDLDALARGFEVTAGDAPAGGWALLLVPRDARLRQVFERIELGGDRHVERVELLERGGDRSRIVFSALTDSPAALAPDEAAQLD